MQMGQSGESEYGEGLQKFLALFWQLFCKFEIIFNIKHYAKCGHLVYVTCILVLELEHRQDVTKTISKILKAEACNLKRMKINYYTSRLKRKIFTTACTHFNMHNLHSAF